MKHRFSILICLFIFFNRLDARNWSEFVTANISLAVDKNISKLNCDDLPNVTSTLKVDFVKIKVDCSPDDKPQIFWEVINEINVQYYSIERSADYHTWEMVGLVKQPMLNTRPNLFTFTDESYESGLVYYRVVGIDKNGSQDVSDSVKAKCKDTLILYTLSPNPASTHVVLNIKARGNSFLEYEVIDNTGKLQLKNSQNIQRQDNISIDVSGLIPGMYSLKFQVDGIVYAEKIMVFK